MKHTLHQSPKASTQGFLYYLNYQKQVAKNTLKGYSLDLDQFLNWLVQEKINTLTNLDTNQADLYMIFLHKQNLSKATRARKCASLRHFFDYLISQKTVTKNPFQHIKIKQNKQAIPHIMAEADLHAFLDHLPCGTFQEARQKCCFEMLYATGIRISELSGLKMQDMASDLTSCKIHAKGNKERLVFLSPTTQQLLKTYLHFRKNTKGAHLEALFLSSKGSPLSTRQLQRELKSYTKKGLLPDWFSPHSFRHAFATALLNRNIPLNTLKTLMGHQSIRSTEVYTHVSLDRLKACINENGLKQHE